MQVNSVVVIAKQHCSIFFKWAQPFYLTPNTFPKKKLVQYPVFWTGQNHNPTIGFAVVGLNVKQFSSQLTHFELYIEVYY